MNAAAAAAAAHEIRRLKSDINNDSNDKQGRGKHNTTQRPHGHTSNPAQHFIKRHEQVIMERHEFTMGPGGMEPGPGRCKDALVE